MSDEGAPDVKDIMRVRQLEKAKVRETLAATLEVIAPCFREGGITERCPKGDELRHVRECDKHGTCTWGPSKVRVCADCRDYRPEHFPTQFAADFHAELERTRGVPYPEGRFSGRGVVIYAGGWRQLPGVYITARMLRDAGHNCRLPIEVWYIGDEGEYEPAFSAITDGMNVTWRDASAELRRLGITRKERLWGWAIKELAILLSSFEQVVGLDADCYPIYDPERLWDDPRTSSKPIALWPDNPGHPLGKPLRENQWAVFGLRKPSKEVAGTESGLMLVDKRRAWHAVQMAAWCSDYHSQFDGTRGAVNGMHGEKDVFQVCAVATGTPFWMAPPVRHQEVAFVQHGPDGDPWFVHRCNDKPRMYFHEIHNSRQKLTHGQYRSATLPCEDLFHKYLDEFIHTLRPPIPGFRDGTQDQQIWNECHILNVYRLPKRIDGWNVLDVGSHAGFFALECLKRGAERVVCVEPWRPNIDQLRANLAPWAARVEVVEAALSNGIEPVRMSGSAHGENYTGEPHVAEVGLPVAAVTLADLIAKTGERVDLLKADCEGSEKHLIGADLSLVDRIAAEWHGAAVDPVSIVAWLEQQGFTVEWNGREHGIGMIYATRG